MKRFFCVAAAALLLFTLLFSLPGCMLTEIIISMQAEGNATFKFTDSGKIYWWGDGSVFGEENAEAAQVLTAVPGVIDFSFGDGFGVWLTREGIAVTGTGKYQPFGDGGATLLCTLNSTGQESSFENYELVEVDLTDARQVAAGRDFALILLGDGTVYGFGSDASGALLQNGSDGEVYRIVRVGGMQLEGITAITASADGLCAALTAEGELVYWGGDTANGGSVGRISDSVFVQAASAGDFIAALDESGNVMQLGSDGKAEQLAAPTDVVSIAAGDGFALAVTRSGEVWSWGRNEHMQLGRTAAESDNIPAPVEGLDGIIAVSCGTAHSAALKKDGTLWAWGAGEAGQLGSGSSDSAVPLQMPDQQSRVNIRRANY